MGGVVHLNLHHMLCATVGNEPPGEEQGGFAGLDYLHFNGFRKKHPCPDLQDAVCNFNSRGHTLAPCPDGYPTQGGLVCIVGGEEHGFFNRLIPFLLRKGDILRKGILRVSYLRFLILDPLLDVGQVFTPYFPGRGHWKRRWDRRRSATQVQEARQSSLLSSRHPCEDRGTSTC